MLQQIFARLLGIFKELTPLITMENFQTENSKAVYMKAKSLQGNDITPRDLIPDAVGCADAVNEVFRQALGTRVGGGASTKLMYEILEKSDRFIPVEYSLPGDIVISPTGYGNGNLPNGHVGIVGKYGIMSNNSETGFWELNYTLVGWIKQFRTFGGFPVRFYRVK